MTEADVIGMLAARYCAPEYAFIPQVRNATGYSSTVRTADGIAMGLWPSRGMEVHGFEVKVDRADFLHEIKQPDKAEEIGRFCDKWWIAVADEKIVKEGEMPPGWGLLAPRGSKLVMVRDALKRECQPLDRTFVAAVLRSIGSKIVTNEHEELQTLRELVSNFQDVSGISLRGKWPYDRATAEAVRIVLNSKADYAQQKLSKMLDSARNMVAAMEAMQLESYRGGLPR